MTAVLSSVAGSDKRDSFIVYEKSQYLKKLDFWIPGSLLQFCASTLVFIFLCHMISGKYELLYLLLILFIFSTSPILDIDLN